MTDNTPQLVKDPTENPTPTQALVRLYKPIKKFFSFSLSLHRTNPYVSCNYRGAGTMYHWRCAKYYLLQLKNLLVYHSRTPINLTYSPTKTFLDIKYVLAQSLQQLSQIYFFPKQTIPTTHYYKVFQPIAPTFKNQIRGS
jgi:hypothetical protein